MSVVLEYIVLKDVNVVGVLVILNVIFEYNKRRMCTNKMIVCTTPPIMCSLCAVKFDSAKSFQYLGPLRVPFCARTHLNNRTNVLRLLRPRLHDAAGCSIG